MRVAVLSLLLVGALAQPSPAAEPSAKDALAEAFGAWAAVAKHVKLSSVRTKTVNGQKVISGRATAFGHRVTLEGAFAGKSVREVSLLFSNKKQLTTDAIVALVGQDVRQLLPEGVGAHINVERLRLEFESKRVSAVELVLSAGTWAPFGARSMDISKLRVSVGVIDPTGRRDLAIQLSGFTRLPEQLGKYLGLGRAELTMSGDITTRPRRLALRVDLTSEPIALGDQDVVALTGAMLELALDERGPALTLRGTLGVRPPTGGPLTLKGDVAINLTGQVYAQAWLEGTWSNPLGLDPRIHVIRPGLGFGVDFSAVPWPMPILALSGGLAVGTDPNKPDFGGTVLVGIHGGDPTHNMIDATLTRLNAADLVRPFAGSVPPGVVKTLEGITITDGRLTVVPPGPGVRLFGVQYLPGFLIRGTMTAGKASGELLVDVSPYGVEAHAEISDISLPGLKITGAAPGQKPSFYLYAKQKTVALALNGAVEVLGLRRAADIYFSDAGFSVTVSGKIGSGFDAKLDVAGASPLRGAGGLFVEGAMQGDFVTALVDTVTGQINAKAKKAKQAIASARQTLARDKPKLAALDRQVMAARKAARTRMKKDCDAFTLGDRSRQAKVAEQKRLNDRIAALSQQIRGLDAQIRGAKTHAKHKKKTLNPLGCGRRQVWDPIHGGGCYVCPKGTTRDATVHIEKLGACSRSTAGWEASRATKAADLAATVADRDVVSKAVAQLGRAANTAGKAACRTAADASMIDQLPGVKELVSDHLTLANAVKAADLTLKGTNLIVGASAKSATWLAKRAGEAAGIITVDEAGFKGCLSQAGSGSVAMHVRGTFADQPFGGAFDVDLKAPEGGFKALADSLFAHGRLPASKGGGSCTRPTVPRPKLGDLQINRRLSDRKKTKRAKAGAPTPPKQPGWAKTPTRAGSAASRATAGADRPGGRPHQPIRRPQTPPGGETALCRKLVDGKIAWDRGTRTQWNPRNLQALCDGTRDGRQTASCVSQALSGKVTDVSGKPLQWQAAVALCAGSGDARESITCFEKQTRGKVGLRQALKHCATR